MYVPIRAVMEDDIAHAASLGVDGVVIGALAVDGTVDVAATARLVQAGHRRVSPCAACLHARDVNLCAWIACTVDNTLL